MTAKLAETPAQARAGRPSVAPLTAICLGYFMVILDTMVVTVALPSIGRQLHTGVAGLQWVTAGYTLVFAGLLLSAGALGDRHGPKRIFQAGLVIFTATSAGCGLAPSVPVLVAARLLQGLGAALMVPASLALLQAAYPDRATRARAFGVWGGVAGIGAASGPIVGGLLIAAVNWRAIFFINLPFGLLAMVLTARCVPAPDGRPRSLDVPAQILGVTALGALTAALIEAGPLGWASPAVLAGFGAAVAAALGFVAAEWRSAAPMLPLRLFASHTFSAANTVGLLINFGFYGQLFVATLYFQEIRGYPALLTGLALLPEGALVSAGSFISGRIMARTGPRIPMMSGLALGGVGMLGLVAAGAHTAYLVLVLPLMAAGLGMSLTMPAATAAVMGSAPADRAGLASGVVNTARQVGGALGVALLGTLVSHRAGFTAGMHTAMLIAGAAFLSGCTLSVLFVERGRRPDRGTKTAAAPTSAAGTGGGRRAASRLSGRSGSIAGPSRRTRPRGWCPRTPGRAGRPCRGPAGRSSSRP
jgi:MFS transporter, DHA2 family, methylenomycin A resistance protein